MTKGQPNTCVLPSVAVNEVESNGDATDWVEVVNTGTRPRPLGWTLIDSDPIGHAGDVTPVAAGTTLAPGAFFVFDGGPHFGFGLGGADVATIRNAAGLTVVDTPGPSTPRSRGPAALTAPATSPPQRSRPRACRTVRRRPGRARGRLAGWG